MLIQYIYTVPYMSFLFFLRLHITLFELAIRIIVASFGSRLGTPLGAPSALSTHLPRHAVVPRRTNPTSPASSQSINQSIKLLPDLPQHTHAVSFVVKAMRTVKR